MRREVPMPTKPDTGVAATKPPGLDNKKPNEDEKQKEAKLRADAETARLQEEAKRRAEAEEARRQQEQKLRAAYDGFMTQGREHVAAKRYAEAIRAYNDALKLIPGDVVATKECKNAEQAAAAQVAVNTKPPNGG